MELAATSLLQLAQSPVDFKGWSGAKLGCLWKEGEKEHELWDPAETG